MQEKIKEFLVFKMNSCYILPMKKRGLFLGPKETAEAFSLRVNLLTPRFNPILDSAKEYFHSLFHATPDWIPLVIDKRGLSFSEAAATWIEEEADKPRTCYIQIKHLKTPFLYSQEEILAHEMVHATRLMFDEPRFEEILAYQTSKARWRRYFGPLFRSSKESALFMGLCTLSWIGSMLDRFFFLLPGVYLFALLVRLIRSQRLFAQALSHLQKTLKDPKEALGVLLRLSDKEIEKCAKDSSD